MNRRSKMILLIACLLLLCLGPAVTTTLTVRSAGRLLTRIFDSRPEAVAEVERSIAGHRLPAGFSGAYVASLAHFSLVAYDSDDGRSHIYLLQGPGALKLDQARLERQLHRSFGADSWERLVVLERYPCRIRDGESVMIISEGIKQDGERYRSASAAFEGRGGPALVNISGPAESWDAAMVAAFVESLR